MTVRAGASKNPEHYRFFAGCFAALAKSASTQGIRIALHFVSALAICVVASASLAQTSTQTSAPVGMSMPTASRVQSPGWWPTKGDATRDSYVGTATCAKCHASKVATQQKHAMARAAVPAADAEILRQHDHLSFRLGAYREEIVTKGGKSVLTVTASDGAAHLSTDLLWAFGVGHLGQTYVYEKNGGYYESHLTFFASTQDLNITPGQSLAPPRTLEDAAGRRMPPAESRACFACHTTASVTNNQLDVKGAVPGVTCEACHGPGSSHVACHEFGTARAGRAADHESQPFESGRVRGFLRRVPPHLGRCCDEYWTWRIEPPLCALPPGKQQVLEQARRPAHLRCLPRSPSASGARCGGLRFTLSAMSRQSARRKNNRRSPRLRSPRFRSPRRGLSGKHEELYDMPHA